MNQSIEYTNKFYSKYGAVTTIMLCYNAVFAEQINSSSPGQNGRHFVDDIVHFHEWKSSIFTKIPLTFGTRGRWF